MRPRLLRAYFYRLFTSPLFYISVAGTAALCCFSRFGGDARRVFENCAVDNFETFMGLDATRRIIVVTGALPFAANFANEWKNASTTSIVSRCGVKKYAFSNVICVFTSTVITVFAGLMIFIGILTAASRRGFAVSVHPNAYIPEPFDYVMKNGLQLVYVAYKSLVLAVSCGAWSVFGLAASALFPNRYVVFCAPIVIDYLLERVTFEAPAPLCIVCLQDSMLCFNSLCGQLAYTVFFFAALSAVFGAAFYQTVKRRVQNEFA